LPNFDRKSVEFLWNPCAHRGYIDSWQIIRDHSILVVNPRKDKSLRVSERPAPGALISFPAFSHSENQTAIFLEEKAMWHPRIQNHPNLWLAAFLLLAVFPAIGQTFRGGISGTVTDQSGAVIPGAQVTAVDTSTNADYKTVTSTAGEFAFSNLPLGTYTVTTSASGFSSQKVNKITVTAGASYTLPVKLAVASASQTVEVSADALALDTATDTQDTVLAEQVIQNLPNSGRDFTQMLSQTTGFAGLSTGGGAGVASVNGSRSNSVNWQIEGTDNNDLWWNIPAVNQGGVSAIAGVILPVDAIENFNFVTTGSTTTGRNSGGTANIVIKSGTNQLHGTAYYYNHNEFFEATNPFLTSKSISRNEHYGFSVGGPIFRDKTFFFLAGEHQGFTIGAAGGSTEPTYQYVQDAESEVLAPYGVTPNPVSLALLYGNGTLPGLWPTSVVGQNSPIASKDTAGNYHNNANLTGHSFNGLIKLDENLTPKDHFSARWFVGQGTQTAPTSSQLSPYFENAPIHVDNFSLIYNRVLTQAISNQLSMGISYFNQVFSDADTDFDPVGLGLNIYGNNQTPSSLAGSPHLVIGPPTSGSGLSGNDTGFDPLGVTAPSGRNDITGHLDEDLIWVKGAHQLHFGGEIRQAQVDDFYQTGQRGTIYFDGSQGPWGSNPSAACTALAKNPGGVATTTDSNTLELADFLAGCFNPGASSIVEGNPKRQVFVNTFSLYGQDQWQLSKALSVNFGARYDYEGPVHSATTNLSIFDPSLTSGLAVAGQDVADIYPKFWGGFSPRVGFVYQALAKTVVRAGFGLYYDSVYMKSILQNNGAQNIPVFGPGLNPAGSQKVASATGQNVVIESGQPIFYSLNQALAGQGVINISTFAKNFRPSYSENWDLNIEHSFTSSVIWQIGYVATKGTHLQGLQDINPEALNAASLSNPSATRPYYSQFPNFGVIDEATSGLGSNYNSLQSTLRVQGWHGLTSSIGYTWSHALDYETGLLPYVAQNPLDIGAEYGNSDYDVRNTVTGYLDYQVPAPSGPKRLVKGWEVNSGFSFHGGEPYTVDASSNVSGNGENADRAVQVLKHPSAGVNHAITGGAVQWFSSSAFVDPAAGTYSPTRRGQNYNPGYSAVDAAILKTTPVTDRVSTQFSANLFNLFNRTNLAPVGFPSTGETGQIFSTIGPYLGNPTIGPGEPFNAEFALRIIF
jgi:hypothetical protein